VGYRHAGKKNYGKERTARKSYRSEPVAATGFYEKGKIGGERKGETGITTAHSSHLRRKEKFGRPVPLRVS